MNQKRLIVLCTFLLIPTFILAQSSNKIEQQHSGLDFINQFNENIEPDGKTKKTGKRERIDAEEKSERNRIAAEKKAEEDVITARKRVEKERIIAVRAEKMRNSMTVSNIENIMVEIPDKGFKMCACETTQNLYKEIMGKNPSYFKGEGLPVECVSWYDAIMFCNELSRKTGRTPYYADEFEYYNIKTGNVVSEKEYYRDREKHDRDRKISLRVKTFENSNGYRLPTIEEWQYCVQGGENYKYSGSDDIEEVSWYRDNSCDKTHSVATKKPNGYGLFDMRGNVEEWVWDACVLYGDPDCRRTNVDGTGIFGYNKNIGFRFVRNK